MNGLINLNLYPYNLYVLYASIVLLVIFLILTVTKLMPLAQAANSLKPTTERMTANLNDMSKKATAFGTKLSKAVTLIKTALPWLLLLKAANDLYNESDENGVKEFGRSTIKAYKKREDEKKLAKNVAKILKK